MVWKPKEKELSPEEAVALARKELAPYWFGSAPLLAGVKGRAGVTLHPLDPKFHEKSWLLFFFDPTTFSGENALNYAFELHRRYSMHNLGMLLIIKPRYHFMRENRAVEGFIRRQQLQFPLVIDAEDLLSTAFRVSELPKVLLWSKGKFIIEQAGPRWSDGMELALQNFLRTADPGLPLLPVFTPSQIRQHDASTLELGQGRGMAFPAPGFGNKVGAFGAAHFAGPRPDKVPAGKFYIHGHWLQDGDRIATSDVEAEIRFQSPTGGFSVVAQSLAKGAEAAKLVIEVNGIPAYDVFGGEDMSFDDEGQSIVRIEGPRLYHVLAKLPEKSREITLRFPMASRAAVGLYALRFSHPAESAP